MCGLYIFFKSGFHLNKNTGVHMKSLHSLWQVIQPFQMVSNGLG